MEFKTKKPKLTPKRLQKIQGDQIFHLKDTKMAQAWKVRITERTPKEKK